MTVAASDGARSAGRGGLAIAVAKVSFVLFGLIQQILLPWVVGVDGYGEISLVLSVVSIVNNVIVATSIQGVSRVTAGASAGKELGAFRIALTLHTALSLVVSVAFAGLAGVIADLIKAPAIALPLRITALVVLCYGVYAPLVGSLNGRKLFLAQAGLDIFYGISRTILLVGGAYVAAKWLGYSGTLGAAVGFAAAAVLILPVAVSRSGTGVPGGSEPSRSEYLTYLGPLFVAQVGLNLLIQTDYLLLSHTAGHEALLRARTELGPAATDDMVTEAARALQNPVLGIYRGVQLFGFLPFQMLMAVQFVLFPMLARAHADQDAESIKRLVRTGIRLALLITGLLAAPIAGLGPQVLRFVYPQAISEGGGEALRIYAPGLACFAILSVTSSALTSLKHERKSALLTWITVGLVASFVLLLRPSNTLDASLINATARGTALGMAAAAVVAGLLLRRVAGAFVSPLSLLRILLAAAVTMVAGRFVPHLGKLLIPFGVLGLMGVYAAVLVLTRELTRGDLGLITSVLGRVKKKPT